MRRPRLMICAALCALAWTALPVAAAEQPAAGTAEPAAQGQARIHKIGPHLYQIGAVVLDAESRTARCPGRVNMNEGGPIELLACLPRGKTHESVFALEVEPTDLQVALLLLGMCDGRNPAVKCPEGSPDLQRPPGDEAVISVEWRGPAEGSGQDPPVNKRRAEDFLVNVKAEGPAPAATWVFLGSRIVDGKFGADQDGSLITTFHDPLAILELALPTVNDDVYYFVNKDVCPPVGTPVELVVQAPPKKTDASDEPKKDASEGGEAQKTG